MIENFGVYLNSTSFGFRGHKYNQPVSIQGRIVIKHVWLHLHNHSLRYHDV